MPDPYLRLRDLLTQPPYDAMSDEAAAEALNAATVASAGSPLVVPDAFAARFTPEEFVAAEDSPDPVVRQLMFRLRVRREPLDLASPTIIQGLAYMASIHLLAPERAAEIGAIAPGALISPREHLGWPEPTIWPADVTAARRM